MSQSWRKIDHLTQGLDLDSSQRELFRLRWFEEAEHYDRLWRRQRLFYRLLRVSVIVGGILVSIFVGVHLRTLSLIAGGLVAITAGLDGFFRFGDRYQVQRTTARRLKAEGMAYIEQRGEYAGSTHRDSFPAFLNAVEDLNTQQSEKYADLAHEGADTSARK